MSNRKFDYLSYLSLVVGICCLLYPFISNQLNKISLSKVVVQQQEAVEQVARSDSSVIEEEKSKANSYNKMLKSSMNVVTDPFDPNRKYITYKDYDSILNVAGDSVMGSLIIPKISVELPIYHGVSDDVLTKGIGHINNTSLPIGGVSTHCVLTGHTGLPAVKILDNLDDMDIGDIFLIKVLDETHAYKVYDIEEVLPNENSSLVIKEDEDLCTLVTCTPYGVNTRRLLVHGRRCDVPDRYKSKDVSFTNGLPSYLTQQANHVLPFSILGILLGISLIVIVKKVNKKHE